VIEVVRKTIAGSDAIIQNAIHFVLPFTRLFRPVAEPVKSLTIGLYFGDEA
jgi:hypothetical protein